MKQLKYVEFQGGSGYWYINCPDALGKEQNQWWYQARLRNISLTDFVLLLKNTYNAEINFNGKFLLYRWSEKNYRYSHNFLLDTNKICRNKKIII